MHGEETSGDDERCRTMTSSEWFRGFWRDGWFVLPHRVEFRDLDAFGHVNNALFFSYFESGRTQLWFDLTGGSDWRDIGFIVARAECDFRSQLRLEEIEIRTRIGEMRNSSLDFHTEIVKRSGEETAAAGKVVVVLWDWAQHSKLVISEELRRRVEECSKRES
jgi:acyl-CoA thioester hydrolase